MFLSHPATQTEYESIFTCQYEIQQSQNLHNQTLRDTQCTKGEFLFLLLIVSFLDGSIGKHWFRHMLTTLFVQQLETNFKNNLTGSS